MSNVNDTVTSATEKTLQISRAPGLGKRLNKLCGALKLEISNRKQLKSLFSAENKTVFMKPSVHGGLVQNEVAFSFWGFLKTDQMRIKLLEFLYWLLNPRVYMSGTNSKTKFLEGIMIFSVNRLGFRALIDRKAETPSINIVSHRLREAAAVDAFESWIDGFFETLQMSAGTLVFKDYLGAQMLSCMERIHHSDQFRSNMFSEHNKDFRLLYSHLVEQNNNNNKVLQATGRHFTTNNFINMFANYHSNGGAANFAADWNWRVLLRTPTPQQSRQLVIDNDNSPVRLIDNEIVEETQTQQSPQLLIDNDNPIMNIISGTSEMVWTSEDV